MITKNIIYQEGGLYHNLICYGNEPVNLIVHTLSGSNYIQDIQMQLGATFSGGTLLLGGSGTGIEILDLGLKEVTGVIEYPNLESNTIKDIE